MFGVGSTIFLHLRHWYNVCYCCMVECLHIGQALYYFFSLMPAIEIKSSEYIVFYVSEDISFSYEIVRLEYFI